MPPCDCLQIDRRFDEISNVLCDGEVGTGNVFINFDYTFQLTNLFGQDVHHCFLAPLDGTMFSPDYFDLVAINPGPLGQGQSVALTTRIKSEANAPSGSTVEFLVTIHNEDFSECCTRQHSVVLPDCTQPLMVMGDVNGDGVVNLLDIQPFIGLISSGQYDEKADINKDGFVDLLDIEPFIDLLGS